MLVGKQKILSADRQHNVADLEKLERENLVNLTKYCIEILKPLSIIPRILRSR